ncbi:MAG: SpoIID/LytB domain-containing protein [Phycisphaerae bacterium]|nr:SpoIID/LytB domain-containing protein [Phycisphaerae bacterium]
MERDDSPTEGTQGHALFMAGIAALALFVVATAWFGPGGCESQGKGSAAERLARPPSPLDDTVDRRGVVEPAEDAAVAPEAPAPRPLPPSTEPIVRIRFASVRGGAVDLAAEGAEFEVRSLDGAESPVQISSPIQVRSSAGSWIVRGTRSGAEWSAPSSRAIELRARNGRGGEVPVSYAGAEWPGVLRLHERQDAGPVIDLVAVLPVERYLPGVLAKELYRSWDLETYRAQAIAARSYAVCEADHWKSRRHFDMVAGEASQAWIGETTRSVARRATDDTRGIVLLYERRVVPAYYSSCCGGAAADAVDAVSRNPEHDIPPLALGSSANGRRPDCCRSAPTYSWTERFSLDDVSRRLAAWGRANGRADLASMRGIVAIDATKLAASGRVEQFRIADDAGSAATISAEAFRSAMNNGGEGSRGSAEPSRRLKSSNFDAIVDGGSVEFSGRGHGHGVGMCQYGAEAMARAGRSWRQILSRYYPGAEPSRCW